MPRSSLITGPNGAITQTFHDTHERRLTHQERALQQRVSQYKSVLKRRKVSDRWIDIYDHIAAIPIPPEWPHADLHPLEYLQRFASGPSAQLAEQALDAMAGWWKRHGKRVLRNEVPEDGPSIELVSKGTEKDATPAEVTWGMTNRQVEEYVAELDDISYLWQMKAGEALHPKYEGGREGAFNAIQARIDFLAAAAKAAGPSPATPEAEGAKAEPEPEEDGRDPAEVLAELEAAERAREEEDPANDDAPDDVIPADDPDILAAEATANAEPSFPCPHAGCPMVASTPEGLVAHLDARHDGATS